MARKTNPPLFKAASTCSSSSFTGKGKRAEERQDTGRIRGYTRPNNPFVQKPDRVPIRLPSSVGRKFLSGQQESTSAARWAYLVTHPKNGVITNEALCPPNPKELLTAARTFASRATCGT